MDIVTKIIKILLLFIPKISNMTTQQISIAINTEENNKEKCFILHHPKSSSSMGSALGGSGDFSYFCLTGFWGVSQKLSGDR